MIARQFWRADDDNPCDACGSRRETATAQAVGILADQWQIGPIAICRICAREILALPIDATPAPVVT